MAGLLEGDVIKARIAGLERDLLQAHQEIHGLRQRVAQVEQMARPGGPARVGRSAPSPAEIPSDKERELLSKAAAVDDPVLAEGYTALAAEARRTRLAL